MRYFSTKAMIDELKRKLASIGHKKLDAWEKANPRPAIPKKLRAKLERDQEEWDNRREAVQEEISEAKEQYQDRILYHNEDPGLLIKDFKQWQLPK